MIYNNLIYFLVAIFTFSVAPSSGKSSLSPYMAAAGCLVAFVCFDLLARLYFSRRNARQTAGYFRAERYSAISALIIYAALVYGLDLKYHLRFLAIDNSVPALVNICGLVIFLALFIIIWLRARPCYQQVFFRQYSPAAFVFSNLKVNLPIVIPWMVLTLCYDLIRFVPWPWLQRLVESPYGDILFFGSFLLFIFIFFPPLVRRLWGCIRVEDGPLRDHLTAFCKRQNFTAKFYLWPLFEGRVITAGVMGFIPGLRYIMITPALLETMSIDELDAVMAHEIGHVKRFHLLLYVLIIAAFGIIAGFLVEPFAIYVGASEIFYSLLNVTGLSPEAGTSIVVGVPILLFLLFYFRFVFGYFMRNFERQADLHVFPVLGNSASIISAFEKIAVLSGNIRDQPSWHHFGIGQRIDYLQKCEEDPAYIGRHHRKVWLSLLGFACGIALLVSASRNISTDEAMEVYEERYTRADLLYNANQEEQPAQWLFFAGNYLLEHKLENRAAIAFELAMERESSQPDLLNNFSWLLLTSEDKSLRDPQRALRLARSAALLKPSGYILDTLATAWWANGFVEEAVSTAEEAMAVDPEKADYYRAQIRRFQQQSYLEELQSSITGEFTATAKQTVKERS